MRENWWTVRPGIVPGERRRRERRKRRRKRERGRRRTGLRFPVSRLLTYEERLVFWGIPALVLLGLLHSYRQVLLKEF